MVKPPGSRELAAYIEQLRHLDRVAASKVSFTRLINCSTIGGKLTAPPGKWPDAHRLPGRHTDTGRRFPLPFILNRGDGRAQRSPHRPQYFNDRPKIIAAGFGSSSMPNCG